MDLFAGYQVDLAPSDSHSWKRIAFKRGIPYLLTGIVIWFLLRQIQLMDIWQHLLGVDLKWIAVGLGWYLLTNVLRAYRFATLMGSNGLLHRQAPTKFSFFTPLHLVPDMIILSFLNNVLPARSGELSFPYILKRRHNTPIGDGLTYLLIVRIFDLLAVATLFVLFVLLAPQNLNLVARQVVFVVVILLLPILLLLLCLPWLGQYGMLIGEWILTRFRLANGKMGQWLLKVGWRAVAAMNHVHHPGIYGRIFFWSLLGWLTTFAWFAAFLHALHVPMHYSTVVVGATFATLSKAIPFITISGFGAHEAGWALGFHLIGVPIETAIMTGFAVNILTLFASSLCALYVYLWRKLG